MAPEAPARGATGDYNRGGKMGNAFEGDIGTLALLSFTCFDLGSQCFAQAGLKLGFQHSFHSGFPRLKFQEHATKPAPLFPFTVMRNTGLGCVEMAHAGNPSAQEMRQRSS